MKIQEIKDKLKALLSQRAGSGKQAAQEQQPTTPQTPAAQVVVIEKHTYAFGFEWRFYTDRKNLGQGLRQAKREGLSHYAVTQGEDLFGVARLEASKRVKKPISASLQLSQVFSRGGLELFVFQLESDSFCLVALNDSRPISGFERVGSRSEILALAGEFQLAQVGTTIRQLGNTGALEHEEPISLTEAFGQVEEYTGVRQIPDYKFLLLTLLGIFVVCVVAFMVYGYFNEAKLKSEIARQARERDPDFIYEREIANSMKNTGLPAQVQLERWRNVILGVPLSKQGWTLTGISCQPDECQLSWQRSYGSYADFFATSQANETRSTESQDAANPAKSSIKTHLKIPPAASVSPGLEREKLSPLQQVQRPLASLLQDISLLANSNVQLKNAELYPANLGLNPQQVSKPVVRGEWGLTHELWSLEDLSFTLPALTLDSLTLVQVDKSSQWLYTLKGFYYAKAK